MKAAPALFAALVGTACTKPAPATVQAPTAQAIDPSITDFLVGSAASDFRSHPPYPAQVRDVRVGSLTTQDGETLYLMCGEFQPDADAGQVGWTQFATIKTSDYEQYTGVGAEDWCERPSITWAQDLTSSLQSQLDAGR